MSRATRRATERERTGQHRTTRTLQESLADLVGSETDGTDGQPNTGRRMTHNPSVGGSSPPRPTPHHRRGRKTAGRRERTARDPRKTTRPLSCRREPPSPWTLTLAWTGWDLLPVPFFIRAGKALARTATELRILFRRPPRLAFVHQSARPEPNQLVLRLDPDPALRLVLQSKGVARGTSEPVHLDLRFAEELGSPPQGRLRDRR
jgi:glucose-6-phosphate dehydrogenase-like protein